MKGECSHKNKTQAIWKSIWSLKVPNTAKVFLWRACNEILPTKDNLKKCRVIIEESLSFAAGTLKLSITFSGSVPRPRTFGVCVEDNFKK